MTNETANEKPTVSYSVHLFGEHSEQEPENRKTTSRIEALTRVFNHLNIGQLLGLDYHALVISTTLESFIAVEYTQDDPVGTAVMEVYTEDFTPAFMDFLDAILGEDA